VEVLEFSKYLEFVLELLTSDMMMFCALELDDTMVCSGTEEGSDEEKVGFKGCKRREGWG
jgi:hypothetical protein